MVLTCGPLLQEYAVAMGMMFVGFWILVFMIWCLSKVSDRG